MPYIKKENRDNLNTPIQVANIYINCAGDLNYVVSGLCNSFLIKHGKSYAKINELIGALECAKMELYRRIAAPYEDIKIKENGDVYTA